MNKQTEKGFYTSPQMEVIEIEVGQIICQSGGTENSSEGNTNDWFTN